MLLLVWEVGVVRSTSVPLWFVACGDRGGIARDQNRGKNCRVRRGREGRGRGERGERGGGGVSRTIFLVAIHYTQP